MKRKDFPEWQVTVAYIRQDGCCAKCGRSLKHGFHRHHKDGDPTNNSPDNLLLLCPECHYAITHEKEWNEHKELERKLCLLLYQALEKVLQGELSGASLERMIMAVAKILSLSRHEKGLDVPPERLPELHCEQEYLWIQGFKEGLKRGLELGLYKSEDNHS